MTLPTHPKKSPCGCDEEKPKPGVTQITVSRGNLERGELKGSPALPAIKLAQDGHVAYADEVVLHDADGRVVGRVIQSEMVRPRVWVELYHPITATVEGQPVAMDTRNRKNENK